MRIRILNGEVWFDGATPAPGFDIDVDKTGPDVVSVEFESADHESRFEAGFEDGELDVEVTENPHD